MTGNETLILKVRQGWNIGRNRPSESFFYVILLNCSTWNKIYQFRERNLWPCNQI